MVLEWFYEEGEPFSKNTSKIIKTDPGRGGDPKMSRSPLQMSRSPPLRKNVEVSKSTNFVKIMKKKFVAKLFVIMYKKPIGIGLSTPRST